jgi:hypothetical protein
MQGHDAWLSEPYERRAEQADYEERLTETYEVLVIESADSIADGLANILVEAAYDEKIKISEVVAEILAKHLANAIREIVDTDYAEEAGSLSFGDLPSLTGYIENAMEAEEEEAYEHGRSRW